ncbi:MAG: 16S rRNA (uracil(1498)-N(3))-methyltransferase [Christensenella sp.]
MRRFFKQNITEDTIIITGSEAMHILRVLRMRVGDELVLFDGSGMDYICEIAETDEQNVTVKLREKVLSEKELPIKITLYQAVIKSDHMDYAVQKCTEAGIYAFVPFLSERCVKRPDAKSAAKLAERESRIALEAAKQCGRARVPAVSELITLKQAATELKNKSGIRLVAYEDEHDISIKDVLEREEMQDISLLIGPEGGFTKSEIVMLEEAGVVCCTLGKLIFRSETAGVAAAAMIQYEYMGK